MNVVVGVDGSAVARNAAAWAAREAVRRGCELRIVYADPTAHAGEDHVRAQVTRWLADAAEHAQTAQPDVKVSTAALPGSPERVLVAESAAAELLVVGDRGFGGFAGLLAGAVAVKVAAHALGPVAVVPDVGDPPTFPTAGPVVVGVDDAESAAPVLAQAFRFADSVGEPLHVVHTWEVVGIDLMWLRSRLPAEEVAEKEQLFLAEIMAGWRERFPNVAVERIVGCGSPVAALINHSSEAQLVVVGAHGRGGVAGAHLGSTSHKLIHHSPAPLLIVRSRP
ncbi:universal stress protein [Saccharopolyspora flava]|uniref:Nucleotide-binding universal stress protein, UspA family n=1 Tax=Saccharopolyspora flava TaxID=95161 RepID=A0A1I6S156_9PSEU|nr:universal stress protein [Saccharopolyspora flava]SFS70693.1 Nucleotide-binding universal stress protein, UspA family [Saccharopolyspora flava]